MNWTTYYILLLVSTYYTNLYLCSEPIRILAKADTHTSEKQVVQTAVRDRMVQHIQENHVDAVIMAGDLAGGVGNSSETDAFVKKWYEPLSNVLPNKQNDIYLGIGNHDYYSANWLNPYTSIMELVKKKHGGLFYSFDLGALRCINLGLYPAKEKSACFCIRDPKTGSYEFLENELKHINLEHPLLLFFHYLCEGPYSDWWKDEEKTRFYNLILKYNVVALVTGHLHSTYKHFVSAAGKQILEVVTGSPQSFAELTFDSSKPREISCNLINDDGTVTQ